MAQSHTDGLLVRVAGAQIQGARDYQEDNYRVLDLSNTETDTTLSEASQFDHTLLILTDGMGGHVGGAKASHIAASEFAKDFEAQMNQNSPDESLTNALNHSNAALAKEVEDEPSLEGMGTTLIGAYITESELFWCSVGDSLLYIFRNGALLRLNADHSMVPVIEKMVAMGELSPEQAKVDPRRNALRSALDGQDINLVDVSTEPYRLQLRDILILASDGLETLSEDAISSLLLQNSEASVTDKAAALLQAVQDVDLPHQDNTTVILYEVHNRDFKAENHSSSAQSPDIPDTILRERPSDSQAKQNGSAATINHTQISGRKSFLPFIIAGLIVAALLIITSLLMMRSEKSVDPGALEPTSIETDELIEGVIENPAEVTPSPEEITPDDDTSELDENADEMKKATPEGNSEEIENSASVEDNEPPQR